MALRNTDSIYAQSGTVTFGTALAQLWRSVLDAVGFLGLRRHLIFELVRGDLRERYVGHAFGAVWHVIHPLLLVAIYVMVFGFIFRASLRHGGNGDYITYAFSGLIPWLVLQEGLNRGTNSVTAQSYLARQAEFPLEVLPIKTALGVLPTLIILTLAFLALCAVRGVGLPITVLLLPLYWIGLFGFLIGMAYILGSLAVFVPDVRDILQVVLSIGLFLTPILYLPGAAPRWLQPIFLINPFTYVILPHKDLVFFGTVEHVYVWVILALLDILVLVVGVLLFRRLKHVFAEAL